MIIGLYDRTEKGHTRHIRVAYNRMKICRD